MPTTSAPPVAAAATARPGTSGAFDAATLDTLERFGTALADPIRRRVLLLLLDGPSYPNELRAAIDTSQPNLSNHLACLRGCGLVTARREGRRMRYELASGRLAHALTDLAGVRLDVEADHADLDGRRPDRRGEVADRG